MKLAFATLGCSGLPLAEVSELALRTGWTGVELRSAPDEPVHASISRADREAARARLAGVAILAIDSYVRCGTTDAADEQVIRQLLAEAELAADLGAQAVRVFPGAAGPGQDEMIIARLAEAAAQLPSGVEIWLETHDSHRTGRDVSRVLATVDDRRVRAIWDVAHPIAAGEALPDTLAHLRPHLAHVQIKDEDSARSPVALGTGVLPLAEILRALQREPYDGWLSLEWEKKWHPEAAELEPTLVAGRKWLTALGISAG